MPRVEKYPLPKTARLWQRVQENDFIDGYAVTSSLSPRRAADVGLAMPTWVNKLLGLRNLLMKPFGLKTELDAQGAGSIFPIEHEDDTEIILGTDDKHLNFRIEIMRHDGRIHMATWVHRNNLIGTIYLAMVMPFHVLIVRDCMKRIARASIASPDHAE